MESSKARAYPLKIRELKKPATERRIIQGGWPFYGGIFHPPSLGLFIQWAGARRGYV